MVDKKWAAPLLLGMLVVVQVMLLIAFPTLIIGICFGYTLGLFTDNLFRAICN